MTLSKIIIVFGLFIFTTTSTLAYNPPVSSTYMPPWNKPLYIPENECTHFVAKEGSDTNPGTKSQPFKTIAKGISQLSTGKKLCIKGYSDNTVYNEQIKVVNKNASSSQPIMIGGYEPDKKVILKGSGNVTKSYSGVAITSSSHIQVIALEVTGFYGGVVTSNKVQNIDLINLIVHNNSSVGINITSSGGPNDRVRIEHSQIFNNVTKNANGGNGGGAVQILNTREGSFRNNKLYRNFGEGLNIGNASNQIIIENSFFSENKHFSFYINHASNILYHRNLTICTGNRNKWMVDRGAPKGQLTDGTAILIRNENSKSTERGYDQGGNNAIIGNVVMGCTEHFAVVVSGEHHGQVVTRIHDTLVANNTFIDARTSVRVNGTENTKNWKADQPQLMGFDNRSYVYEGDVYAYNNLLVAHSNDVSVMSPVAASIGKIHVSNNLTNKSPGFNQGIMVQTNLPFQNTYDRTNPEPWNLSNAELEAVKRRFMLANNSPAINAGTADLPQEFRALYQNYYNRDYFGNSRGTNPDIGAHESNGTVPPTPTTGPSPTPSPTPTTGPTVTSGVPTPTSGDGLTADFDDDGDVDIRDLLSFIPRFDKTTAKFDVNASGRVDVFDFNLVVSQIIH